MALIKSTVLAQISGSINGITFSHNAGGAYARNRSIPSNPGTDRQDEVRTALASLSKAWAESLTETERNLWRVYGAGTTVINRLGDQITLSGIAAFQRINLFRMSSLDQTPITTPPALHPTRDPAPSFQGAESAGVDPGLPVQVILNLPGGTTDYGVSVYYSGPLSPGIRYYRGPYLGRESTVLTAGDTTTVVLTDLIQPAGEIQFALKITCYGVSDSLPIWTVHTDPLSATV